MTQTCALIYIQKEEKKKEKEKKGRETYNVGRLPLYDTINCRHFHKHLSLQEAPN